MAFEEKYLFTQSFSKNSCISVSVGNITIGEVFLNGGFYEYGENSFEVHNSQFFEILLLLKRVGKSLVQRHNVKKKQMQETDLGELRTKCVPSTSSSDRANASKNQSEPETGSSLEAESALSARERKNELASATAGCVIRHEKNTNETNHSNTQSPISPSPVSTAPDTRPCTFPDTLELSATEVLRVSGEKIILERTKFDQHHCYEIIFDHFLYIQFLRCFRDLCLFSTAPSISQYEALTRFHKKANELNISQGDFEINSQKLRQILVFASESKSKSPHENFLIQQFLKMNLPVLYAYLEMDKLIGS